MIKLFHVVVEPDLGRGLIQCQLEGGESGTGRPAWPTPRQKRCRMSDLEVLDLASLNKTWFSSWTELSNENVLNLEPCPG